MHDSNSQGKPKQNSPTAIAQTLKKSKGPDDTRTSKPRRANLWFGFAAMEELAKDVGAPFVDQAKMMEKVLKLGFLESKAQEMQLASFSFPVVHLFFKSACNTMGTRGTRE